MSVRVVVVAALALCVSACLVDATGDAGTRDAGALRDAANDAGPLPDASAIDASGWRTEPPLPAPRQELAARVHDGRIHVVGGFVRGVVVDTVLVHDPETGAFEVGPSLPAPRHHLALVTHEGDLYALGGMETAAFEPLDTAFVLRAGATAWEPIATLPEDRAAGAADSVDGRIVLVGGNQSRGGLASRTLLYDPQADTWSFGREIPTPREHLAAITVDGELFAIGGRLNSLGTNQRAVEIYDPVTDAWREGPPLETARGGFDVGLLDGALYAVGGEQSDRALESVERLDLPLEGSWSLAQPLPLPRHGHAVVALGGRLYVVGGADAPAFAPVDLVSSYAP